MKDKWQTISEYARDAGLNRSSVSRAVKDGRIRSNGKTGRDCRVRGPMAEPVRNTFSKSAAGSKIEDLAGARLENLKRDAILKDQRIKKNQEAQWRLYADATCEDYLAAFAPITARLTEMRLPVSKLAILRKIIEECTADFFRRQKMRWEDHEAGND